MNSQLHILSFILVVLVLKVSNVSAMNNKHVYKSKQVNPKSCVDYLRNGYKSNGYYQINAPNAAGSSTITVYCDMNSEAGAAWTLVMSFTLENIKMHQFKKSPLQINAPVNENSPNWNLYRMSLSQMTHLKSQSTHWRATCSFPTYGVDYIDYVRANFAQFDIMTFLGYGICKKVEYIDVRGHRCAYCTSRWWQQINARNPHLVSSYTGCEFIARQGAVSGEDNFGLYSDYNKKFRCSSGAQSTTNWWFGGYQ